MNPNTVSRAHAPGENPARPLLKESAPPSLPNQYAELKRLIKQRGLLDRQPAYYLAKTVFTLGLLVVSLVLLFVLGDTPFQLLNAAYLAFVFVQISLLSHDFGHRQFTFNSAQKNDWLTLVFGNLLLGLSRQWWIDKHNEHHGHPNQLDLDPDVDIPLLAFEEEQALEKRGFARFVVKYQAALIFPLSLLQSLSMLRSSIEFLAAKKAKSTLVEALMICAHFALYFGLLFSVLDPLLALLFIAVHRGLFGTYMVSIFAPNHKAMPLLERDSEVDFLHRQVLTSRNVLAHPYHRLLVRWPQLPDRTPPVPQDAAQQAARSAADHQELLPGSLHRLPRDQRAPVLQRDPAAPPRGRRSATRSRKNEVTEIGRSGANR